MGAGDETIMHSGLFKLPTVEDGGEVHKAIQDVIAQFNTLPGIKASFRRAGTASLDKAAFLAEVDWPDKTADFTHCLCVICDSADALKGYLHGDAHKAWVPVVRPHFVGTPPSLIFDNPLIVSASL